MDKDGNIRINHELWKEGIASSPSVGMGDIVNLDIFDTPGVVKIDYAPTEISNAQLTSEPTCCTINNDGVAVIGTDDAQAHKYNGTTFTAPYNDSAGDFTGVVWWKGYALFADFDVNNNRIRLSSYNGGTTVITGFENMTTNSLGGSFGDYRFSSGAIIVGDDDVVYVGSGRYVGSLTEKAGQTFDPGNSGTYTWNAEALDLAEEYEIDGFSNYNDFLMISAGNPKTRTQNLFPWDRTSASFDFPTPLNNGVAGQMITKDNILYVLNGTRGLFTATNRSSVVTQTRLDNINYPSKMSGVYQTGNPLGIIDDTFFLAISNGAASASDNISPVGVYKIRDNAITRLTLSNDTDGSDGQVYVYFTTPFQYNKLLVGWQYDPDAGGADTFGVDEFGKSDYRYTGYKASMESPLWTVGRSLQHKSYTQLEISLARNLTTGQGIKVQYRKGLSDSWTTITNPVDNGDNFDFATYGSVRQINAPAKILDARNIQIKVSLTTGVNSTTTPELKEVRLF